jgi:fructose-1,6-bisphosphatase I
MIPTMTLNRFIRERERGIAGTTGELTELLSALALGTKLIRNAIVTSGSRNVKGYTELTNVQGERVHSIDQEADEILVELLASTGHFGSLVTEERDAIVTTTSDRSGAKYVVAFDPLDGSSNLGSSIPVGTIFSIWRKRDPVLPATLEDFKQPGRTVVAAGYAVYGASTSFVYSAGQGVHSFTLHEQLGEFVLTDEGVRTPERGSTYSVNEGNSPRWDARTRNFIESLKSPAEQGATPYSARYAGSLVADFDRNLRRGGIFLYPADTKSPKGKLRLLYECIPLAFIAEQAGGAATDGSQKILDILPTDIHQRSPFIVGGRSEINEYLSS